MDITKSLGFIEKRIRKKQGLSLENVSKDLKISKGNLSEIENGRRPLNEALFRQFVERYKINFDFDLGLLNEIEQLLQELMEAYTYKNFEKERQITRNYNLERDKYEYSFGCLYLPFLDVFLTNEKQPNQLSVDEYNAFSEVLEYFPAYVPDEKALFLYIKAFTARKNGDLKKALSDHLKAIETLNGKKWPQLEGIIKMNYAIEIAASQSFFAAYLIGQEAQEIFSKYENYVRSLMCSFNQANYLICLQEYAEVKDILNRVLLSQKLFTGYDFHKLAVSMRASKYRYGSQSSVLS